MGVLKIHYNSRNKSLLVHVNLRAYSCYNIHITKLFIRASIEQVVTSEIVIKVG